MYFCFLYEYGDKRGDDVKRVWFVWYYLGFILNYIFRDIVID